MIELTFLGAARTVTGSKHLLRTVEFSPLEPSIVERKVYRPGVGVVSEQQLSGGHETLSLVRVTG